MNIDDTIQTLTAIRQSIATWIPQRTTRPDALIADLNELYVESIRNRDMDDLFEYNDVGSPSITLIVGIDADFDLKAVMEHMRTRLQITQPGREDEIGHAGVVWSHGRYDFVYDKNMGSLRVSHRYSHRRVDTKSVASIANRMIDYAMDYLEEVKVSAEQSTSTPETE